MPTSREITAVGQQALLGETIRREMRAAARADGGAGRAMFAPRMQTAVRHKFTPQPGHEPSPAEVEAAGSAQIESELAAMTKTPRERVAGSDAPLPQTQAQEIGWFTASDSFKKLSMMQTGWNPHRMPNISCDETRFAGEYYKLRGTMPNQKQAERGGKPYRPGVLG